MGLTRMMHYERYDHQMRSVEKGLALWQPDPDPTYNKVEIGDVGHMQKGHFVRLFNASLPQGDPRNQGGVPEGYEPLVHAPDHTNTLFETLKARVPLWSTDLSAVGVNVDLSVQLPPLDAGACIRTRIETSSGSGGMLVTGQDIQGLETSTPGDFEDYIIKHYTSWFKFARNRGSLVEPEDLILVTGCHVTADYYMFTFSEENCNVKIGFDMGFPGVASGGFSAAFSSGHRTSPFINSGPNPRNSRRTPIVEQGTGTTLAELQATSEIFTQCVFLNGYRVKKKMGMFPKVMKAAAGPHDLGSGERDKEYEAARAEVDSDTSSDGVEMISDNKRTVDPTHSILDYILNTSDATLALVHDKDLNQFYKDFSIQSHEDLTAALYKVRPNVTIMHGVGRIVLNETERAHSIPKVPSAYSLFPSRDIYRDDGPLIVEGEAVRGMASRLRHLPPIRKALGDILDTPVKERRARRSPRFSESRGQTYGLYKTTQRETIRDTLRGDLDSPVSLHRAPRSPESRGSTYDVYKTTHAGELVHTSSLSSDHYKQRPFKAPQEDLTRKYTCDECGVRFDRPNALENHRRTHTGEKPFQCRYPGCTKTFASGGNRIRHERTHGAETVFVNRDDEQGEAGPSSGHSHSSNETKQARNIPMDLDIPLLSSRVTPMNDEPLPIDRGGVHGMIFSPGRYQAPSLYTPAPRTIPSLRDTLREDLDSPVTLHRAPRSPESHEPTYGVYTTIPGELIHEQPLSADDYKLRPLKAPQGNLMRKYACPECGERFDKPTSLEIHSRIHTGERPYKCPYPGCAKTFNVHSNLRRHERTHDTETASVVRDDEQAQAGSSSVVHHSSNDTHVFSQEVK